MSKKVGLILVVVIIAILGSFQTMAIMSSGEGTYVEEKLFESDSRSYLITIKATSPEALQRGIEKRGENWQVVRFYEAEDSKDGFKYRAHLVASPSH